MNECRLVLIIHNRLLDPQEIKDDLKQEKFPYYFIFGEDIKSMKVTDFDEVWTFGEVRGDKLYKLAKANNMDIWEMG